MTANNGQTSCGHAPARQWTSYSGLPVNYRFIADASGYDLRGADDYYSAIINTQNSNCTIHDEIAIHEFGHLFGAGHEYSSLTANGYLYDDSYANPIFLIPGGGRTRYRSIVATVGSYKLYNHFSDQSLAAQTNNHRAVLKTASSVARYRASGTPVDPPPVTPPLPPPVVVPGCGLSPAVSLTGALYATCVPFPATTHTITWYDTCPGATVDYQIEYSQPDGAPYVVLGSTPNIWEYISVNGASSRLRVRACNGATCSSPSGTYLANDSC